jgi:hypothetical protein
MALYMMQVKPLSRGRGQSATAAAAYRSGTLIACEREGRTHDYSRKSGILKSQSQVVLPMGVDADWLVDRDVLWNAAERVEKRKDARVAREYIVALPHEATAEERLQLAVQLSQYLANTYGVVVDMNIHAPHQHNGTQNNNHHAHLLTTTRLVTQHGLGEKSEIELSNTDRTKRNLCSSAVELKQIRAHWAELQNTVLAQYGIQVSALSLQDQGIDREPTLHLGPQATALERMGIHTDIGNINRAIEQENARRAAQAAELAALDQQIFASSQIIDRLQTHYRDIQHHERSKAILRAHRATLDTADAVSHAASTIGRATDQHESTATAVGQATEQHGSTSETVGRAIHTALATYEAIHDYLNACQDAAAAHAVNRAITATVQVHRDIADRITYLTHDADRHARTLSSMSHTTDLWSSWSSWSREQVESIDARVAADKKKHFIETTVQEFIKSQDIYADYMHRYNALVSQYPDEDSSLEEKIKPSSQHPKTFDPMSGGRTVYSFEEDEYLGLTRYEETFLALCQRSQINQHVENMHRLKKILDDHDVDIPAKNTNVINTTDQNAGYDYFSIDFYYEHIQPRRLYLEAKAAEKTRVTALEKAQYEAEKKSEIEILRQMIAAERLAREQQRLEQETSSVQQPSQPASGPSPTAQISTPARQEQKKDDRNDFERLPMVLYCTSSSYRRMA